MKDYTLMEELSEQQKHLQSLLNQREEISQDIVRIESVLDARKVLLNKAQGAIEYLGQIGITLPTPTEEIANGS